MKNKYCVWGDGQYCYEFDAKNQNNELEKVRQFAKENNIKIEDMKKEN